MREQSLFDHAAIRGFAAEMQASTGDDLGPLIWRDVQRLADGYERAIAALKDILDAAERGVAGFPIESEEWYARRDYARIQIADSEREP